MIQARFARHHASSRRPSPALANPDRTRVRALTPAGEYFVAPIPRQCADQAAPRPYPALVPLRLRPLAACAAVVPAAVLVTENLPAKHLALPVRRAASW